MAENGSTRSDRAPGSAWSWSTLGHDLLASLVVFLVALPLCMGIALASGVPPDRAAAVGIITGIVGGIVVGLLGGSPLQVSGPAAGLIVIVFDLLNEHRHAFLQKVERSVGPVGELSEESRRALELDAGYHALGALGLIVLLAGLLQLGAGLLRLGQWFRAVSPAVIHGMLAGIGVLIVASQFHLMLDDAPRQGGIANLLALPEAVWKGVVPQHDVAHDDAARIGMLTIATIVLWKLFAPKRLQLLPAPLVAIVIAAGATVLLDLPINRVNLPGSLFGALQLPAFELLADPSNWRSLLLAALSIAFIASAETLLCATAVDQMHQGARTRYSRELAAQGIGNSLAGLLGGLPMTGVIVRSAANVNAGARTRLSAILHGVWLLTFACVFAGLLQWVPTAALAAILVYTGFKLIDPAPVRYLWKTSRSEVLIYGVTLVTIVATDLLTGVLVGVAIALVKLAYTFSHLRIDLERDSVRHRTVLHLDGTATFIRLPQLAAALETIPGDTELHVDLTRLEYIDHACLELMLNWGKQHEAAGGSLVIDWKSLRAKFRHYGKKRRHVEAPTNASTPEPQHDGQTVAR